MLAKQCRIMTVAAAALLIASCGDDGVGVPTQRVYEVDVVGERFRIALTDAQLIQRAETLLASGFHNNIHGTLRRGSGGFNAPYSWHLDPETVTFPDITTEVCDGRPMSDVESDIAYWVDTIK